MLEAQPQRSQARDPFEPGKIATREGFRILSRRRRIGADGSGAIDEPTTHLLQRRFMGLRNFAVATLFSMIEEERSWTRCMQSWQSWSSARSGLPRAAARQWAVEPAMAE
ncbi:MAG TPA: hypothetical protein VJV77_16375 [Casimicrobiaceae bacterium]|nr:hypothetical protein [Casimicrobiaceae bacterium]